MNTARPFVDDETIDRRFTAYTEPGFVLVAPLSPLAESDEDRLLRVLRVPDLWQMLPLYLIESAVAHPVYLLYPFVVIQPLEVDLRGKYVSGTHEKWVEAQLARTHAEAVSRVRLARFTCETSWIVNTMAGVELLRRTTLPDAWYAVPNAVISRPSQAEKTSDQLRRLAHALGVPLTARQWAMRPRAGNVMEAQARAGEVTWVRG